MIGPLLIGPRLFLDQIEADAEAEHFLGACARIGSVPAAFASIQWHTHEGDGRTGSLWVQGRLVACTVVLRDDLNRSVLTCAVF